MHVLIRALSGYYTMNEDLQVGRKRLCGWCIFISTIVVMAVKSEYFSYIGMGKVSLNAKVTCSLRISCASHTYLENDLEVWMVSCD